MGEYCFSFAKERRARGLTNLYRHYSGTGKLLYIGISISAITRLKDHKIHAHWFDQIRRIEITQYPSREGAAMAEQWAIERERPLYNVQGRLTDKQFKKLERIFGSS